MDTQSTLRLSDTPRPRHDTSDANISGARGEFIELLGSGYVVSEFEECRSHSNTPWSLAKPSHTPSLVVFPASTAAVSAIMKVCFRRQIPVTAFSGGDELLRRAGGHTRRRVSRFQAHESGPGCAYGRHGRGCAARRRLAGTERAIGGSTSFLSPGSRSWGENWWHGVLAMIQ